MGRLGISYLEVAEVASVLQGKGINPTVDAIREILGTGSRSTIGPYLKQWRNKHELLTHNGGLPLELVSHVKGLYDRLEAEADAKVEEVIKAKQSELFSTQGSLQAAHSQIGVLEKEIEGLSLKLKDVLQREDQLRSELEIENKKSVSAQAKIEIYELRVQDKEAQVHALTKQLGTVQTNLEHYRESTRVQREEEKRTREREVGQLHQEIQGLKQQLVAANHQNTEFRQALAKERQDKHSLQQEWYEQKGITMELQERLKNREEQVQGLEETYQDLSQNYQDTCSKWETTKQQLERTERETWLLEERLRVSQQNIEEAENAIRNLEEERLFLRQESVTLKADIKKLEQGLALT